MKMREEKDYLLCPSKKAVEGCWMISQTRQECQCKRESMAKPPVATRSPRIGSDGVRLSDWLRACVCVGCVRGDLFALSIAQDQEINKRDVKFFLDMSVAAQRPVVYHMASLPASFMVNPALVLTTWSLSTKMMLIVFDGF